MRLAQAMDIAGYCDTKIEIRAGGPGSGRHKGSGGAPRLQSAAKKAAARLSSVVRGHLASAKSEEDPEMKKMHMQDAKDTQKVQEHLAAGNVAKASRHMDRMDSSPRDELMNHVSHKGLREALGYSPYD